LSTHTTQVPSRGVLDARLDVQVERVLEPHDPLRVPGRDVEVADRHEAAGAVEQVGQTEERELTDTGPA
jgi:hypothetical protein